MITTIRIPQLDVNDPDVTVAYVSSKPGDLVTPDTELAVVETMKASISVTADRHGIVRSVLVEGGQTLPVGTPLFIIADDLDEPLGADALPPPGEPEAAQAPRTTAKAKLLAKKAAAAQGAGPTADMAGQAARPAIPHSVGKLSRSSLGVMDSVLRSRENVSAYLEVQTDLAPALELARKKAREWQLLFDPLFPLICWQATQLVAQTPALNAAWLGGELIEYREINLGFTLSVEGELLFPVIRRAEGYSQKDFANGMFAVQRRAAKGRLEAEEVGGATFGVTSLAAYGVTRHIPVLFPGTSLMLAVSASSPLSPPGTAFTTLGAAYDHRIHNGVRIAKLLRGLAARLGAAAP